MSLATLLAQVITEMKNDPTCRRCVGPLEAALTEPPVSGDTPTEPVRPLEALIAEWRNLRAKAADVGLAYAGKHRGFEASGVCEGLDRCIEDAAALLQAAAPPAPTAELMRVSVDDVGDHVCQHGTALDVHCCNCHSGFIFDKDHECPSPDLGLHRCKVCGTRWLLWPDTIHGGGWNLLDKYQRPGTCCDNVAMGEQIEHLRDIPLSAAPPAPTAGREITRALDLARKAMFTPPNGALVCRWCHANWTVDGHTEWCHYVEICRDISDAAEAIRIAQTKMRSAAPPERVSEGKEP